MTEASLRDILLAHKGRVALGTIRLSVSWTTDKAFREALEFLLDNDLALAFRDDGTSTDRAGEVAFVQALDGMGRPVEPPRGVRVSKDDPPCIFSVPKLSEGSARRAASMRAAAITRVENGLEALRAGASLEEAIGVGSRGLRHYRDAHPELYQKVRSAQGEFRAKSAQVAAENRLRDEATVLELLRKGLNKVSQVAQAKNWSEDRALLALQRLKQKALVEWRSSTSGWKAVA